MQNLLARQLAPHSHLRSLSASRTRGLNLIKKTALDDQTGCQGIWRRLGEGSVGADDCPGCTVPGGNLVNTAVRGIHLLG